MDAKLKKYIIENEYLTRDLTTMEEERNKLKNIVARETNVEKKAEAIGKLEELDAIIADECAKRNVETMKEQIGNLCNIDGAFNFIISFGTDIYAMRDSLGMRPLVIGKCNNMICITSESSLFNKVGFCYYNEIAPGEIVRLRNNKLESK